MDEQNARHARDYVNCTRAETIELYEQGMAAVTAALRAHFDSIRTTIGARD